MSDRPRRWKEPDELTVDEHRERQEAERRGESARFETDEYRRARHKALTDAGLEADETDTDPARDEPGDWREELDRWTDAFDRQQQMTVEDHARRKYGEESE
jgi:hypothetical protein